MDFMGAHLSGTYYQIFRTAAYGCKSKREMKINDGELGEKPNTEMNILAFALRGT